MELPTQQQVVEVVNRAIASAANGILITDPNQTDNPIIYANDAFAKKTGYSRAEIIGKNCRFMQGADREQPGISDLRDAVREGKGCEVVLRNYKKNGEMFFNKLTISPVRNESGSLTHFIGIGEDISRHVFNEKELRAANKKLSDRIKNLYTSEDDQDGRFVRILLIEDNPGDIEIFHRSLKRAGGFAFSLKVAGRLESSLAALESTGVDIIVVDLNLPDSSGIDTFFEIRAAVPDTPIVVLSGAEDRELALTAVREGAQDYMIKGVADEEVLTRNFLFAIERHRRVEAQRSLDIATQKIAMAHRVQQTLFPTSAPTIEGFDIAGAAFPAEAGCGDYFDFIELSDNRLMLVVADVAGHGIDASLLMVETRAILRALSASNTPAKDTAHLLNLILSQDIPVNRFVTMFLATLDTQSRTLSYVGAGHNAHILSADGSSRELASTTLPLGVEDIIEPEAHTSIRLEPGDIVLMPTDGIHECLTSDMKTNFGVKRMLGFTHANRTLSAKGIVESLYQVTREFSGHGSQTDDITAIVMKILD